MLKCAVVNACVHFTHSIQIAFDLLYSTSKEQEDGALEETQAEGLCALNTRPL